MSGRDHYRIFELPTDARPADVRSRWRALRNLYEDELGTYGLLSAEERVELLAEVDAAWAVLGDPEARRRYDAALRAEGHEGPWYEPGDDSGAWAETSLDRARPDDVRPAPTAVAKDAPSSTGDTEGPSRSAGSGDEGAPATAPEASSPRPAAASTPMAPPELPAGERMHGAWLRKWREYRQIDLRDLSNQIKITVTQLENIEAHRFDRLPASVYLKGFLRNYARALGLDGDRTVGDYMELRRIWEEGGR